MHLCFKGNKREASPQLLFESFTENQLSRRQKGNKAEEGEKLEWATAAGQPSVDGLCFGLHVSRSPKVPGIMAWSITVQ